MRFLAAHENANRGSFNFPYELYNIEENHPRYEMPFHWHVDCEIIRVLSGEFTLTLNDSKLHLKQGNCVFVPSGVIHGGVPKECRYQCIVFSFEKSVQINIARFLEYENELGQGDYLPPIYEKSELIDKLFIAMEQQYSGYEFVVQGAILQLIGGLIKDKKKGHTQIITGGDNKRINKVKDVLRLIRKDYAKPLSLEMLADKAQLNYQYLCKSFRRITGKTPIEYLNYYRIECAAELLKADKLSVTDVAFSCGFNDISYFIKLFKRHKGMSPGAFKKHGKIA